MIEVFPDTSNGPRRRISFLPAYQAYFSLNEDVVDGWAGLSRSRGVGNEHSQNFFGRRFIQFWFGFAVTEEWSHADFFKAFVEAWIESGRVESGCLWEHIRIRLKVLAESLRSSIDQGGTRLPSGIGGSIDKVRTRVG